MEASAKPFDATPMEQIRFASCNGDTILPEEVDDEDDPPDEKTEDFRINTESDNQLQYALKLLNE